MAVEKGNNHIYDLSASISYHTEKIYLFKIFRLKHI